MRRTALVAHLHGKKRVLLPLMNREIPIITDELAQPEFGTEVLSEGYAGP